MDNLQKQTWHDRLLAVVWASCGILPLPLGAFASDRPYIASASILAFFILSFAIPLWLGYRRRRAGRDGDYASSGATLYGGAVVLLVAVGLLNGLTGLDCWHSYPVRVGLFALWMFLTVAIQYLAARAVDFWKGRRRKYWYSQFIDPIVYSLPLPCAVLGMFLFPAVSDSSVTQSLVVGIMAIMGFCFIGMSIFVIATFAFYFFPYKRYGYQGEKAAGPHCRHRRHGPHVGPGPAHPLRQPDTRLYVHLQGHADPPEQSPGLRHALRRSRPDHHRLRSHAQRRPGGL